MNKIKIYTPIVIIVTILVVHACHSQKKKQSAGAGGAVTIALPGKAGELFPYSITSYDMQELNNHILCPPLTLADNRPQLVSGWQFNADKRQILYYIDAARRWSDGSPLTAYDIRATWRFIRQYADSINPVYRNNKVDSCLVIDSMTVAFQFNQPVAHPERLTRFPVLPAEVSTADGWKKARVLYTRQFKGLGPYILKRHSSQKVVLTRNPYHSAPLDSLIIQFYATEKQLLSGLTNRLYDLAPDVSPAVYQRFKSTKYYTASLTVERGYTFIAWNLRKPPTRRGIFRQALTRAIDRPTIVDGLLGNLGVVHDAPAYPSFPAYLDTVAYPFAPDSALAILKTLPYRKPLRLLVNKENSLRLALARNIQNYWQAVGIKTVITVLPWPAFIKALRNGDYDAALIAWVANDYFNPGDLFLSASIKKANNFMHYQNQVVDTILNRALTAPEAEEQKQLWQRFQRLVIHDLPVTILYSKRIATVRSMRLRNTTIDDSGYLHHPEKWYVESSSRLPME